MSFTLHSPLRVEEHRVLAKCTLEGRVLDLGGSKYSKYQKLFNGTHEITTLNIDERTNPDIVHDLELNLPIENNTYNAVLMVNVLEHIYAYRQLVEESFRVLQKEGRVICVVPFLFPEHPSPSDFHRFTKEALQKLFEEVGYREVEIEALGSGVFLTSLAFFDRLLPFPLRLLSSTIGVACSRGADWIFSTIAHYTGRGYDPSTYALGFMLRAKK